MPDATYVGAGMPCGNCGNPLTPGQPHKCGRVGNPYAPSPEWKPGQDTFTSQAAGIWDEGFAAGRAADRNTEGVWPDQSAMRLPVNEPQTATPIPDSEFVEPPLMPSDPISERMIDVADDAFRSGSSDEQAWRECLGDALYAVYPLIREQVMAEASQGKRAVSALLPVNEPETDT